MVFLKNAELAEGHADQKHKGRDVFLGDQVKDQDFNFAIFDDLGSAPPTMEAARALDAVSLFPGYEQQQSDATSAYTQSFLRGKPTWISLPRERWPKSWEGKYTNPVVRLMLSLYGHPDAGTYWEQDCARHVKVAGFEEIDGWTSVFWHPVKKALLIVYVDDFNLACPSQHTAGIWSDLRKNIKMDDPGPPGRFLGCYREKFEVKASCDPITKILSNNPELHLRGADKPTPLNLKNPDRKVKGYSYDMTKYTEENVRKYLDLVGVPIGRLRPADTPFLDE